MSFTPIVNLPFKYAFGCAVSSNATTPNTQLDVSSGQFRDVNNTNDLVLSSGVTIDATKTGMNGLDTGTLAASTWYYIYLVGSSGNAVPTGAVASTSATGPTLPVGCDLWRLISYRYSNSSTHFAFGYDMGSHGSRQFHYDTVVAVLSAGTATALTAVSLATAVPPVQNLPVYVFGTYTPATAGDKVSLFSGDSVATVGQFIDGSVAAKANSATLKVVSRLVSSNASIQYINSASSGSTNLWVASFDYFV